MDNEGRSCVYGLRHQARCLTAVIAETEQNKFLVGSQTLKRDNEIHLINFNEDEFEITSTIYQHLEEVWDIAACPAKSDLFFTCYKTFDSISSRTKAKLWRMNNSDVISEDFEKGSRPPRSTSHLPLECIFEIKEDDTIKKVLWDPKKDLTKFVSIHDSSLRIWEFDEQMTSAKTSHTVDFSSMNESLPPLTTGVWNPHQPEVAIGKECYVQGLDLRSQSQTFNINGAHSVLVHALDYNPNKPYQIASAGDDCKIRFWDLRNTTNCLKQISDHTHWVWAIAYNRFHDQLFLSSSSDCQVNLQSIVSISSGAFQYDERENDDGSEYEYHDQLGKPTDGLVRAYDQHEDSVYAVAWSACDPWVFCSLSYDGRAVINRVPKEEKYKIIL
ncbi:WD40 repeat-like protein [Gigaspora margarita]|uniref:WD40 repeat-like protein n=1 Tax=Gigaspora margarita TaxID=4874 RepID=A0A8H3WY73_GIGMA|nr:WD40 repeat-like protein [Gigaspora margarita]